MTIISDKELIDKLMRAIIELEEVKMKFVKEQNFTDAGKIREAQNLMRELVRYYDKLN